MTRHQIKNAPKPKSPTPRAPNLDFDDPSAVKAYLAKVAARKATQRATYLRAKAKKSDNPPPMQVINPPLRRTRNGGFLRSGNPGNKGGPGATPGVLRHRFREDLRTAMHHAKEVIADCEAIITSPTSTTEQRLKSMDTKIKTLDFIGKFSGVASISLTDGDGNAIALPAMVVSVHPDSAPPDPHA